MKVYPVDQLLLLTTIPVLLNHVSIAKTEPVVMVPDVGIYCTLAVGAPASTSKDELTAQLIVPSLTCSVTHVFTWVRIVFKVLVDCPTANVTHVVYVGVSTVFEAECFSTNIGSYSIVELICSSNFRDNKTTIYGLIKCCSTVP
jgi:hypothetical protein